MLANLVLAAICVVAQEAPPAMPPAPSQAEPAHPELSAAVARLQTSADRAAAELAAKVETEGEFAWTPILIELRGHGLAGARQIVLRLGSEKGMLAVLAAESLKRMGPVAWPALAEGLGHEHAATRAGSAFVLGELGSVVILLAPLLVPLLDDPDERTALMASVAMLRIVPGPPPGGKTREELVARVAGGLAHEDPSRREEAVSALGRLAAFEAEAREILQGVLQHKDLRLRTSAVRALFGARVAPSEAMLDVVVDLIAMEPPPTPRGDAAAAQAYSEWRDGTMLLVDVQLAGATPALVARLAARVAQETGDKYRYAPAFSELRIHVPEMLGALIQETSACDEARFSAARALGERVSEHHLLRAMLRSPDEITRVAAVYGLGTEGPYASDSVADLEPLLEDESDWVRKTLATALGRIAVAIPNERALPAIDERNARTVAAVPWLMQLADDDRFADVSQQAYDGLMNLGGARVNPVLVERLASPDPEWRRLAAQLAGEVGTADPALRGRLEAAASDEDRFLRIFALGSMGQLWDDAGVVSLLEREAVDADMRQRVRRELVWLQRSDSTALAEAAKAALERIPEP